MQAAFVVSAASLFSLSSHGRISNSLRCEHRHTSRIRQRSSLTCFSSDQLCSNGFSSFRSYVGRPAATFSLHSSWLGSRSAEALRHAEFFVSFSPAFRSPLPFFECGHLEIRADYYSTLGITRSATKDEIKKQYRKLARQYHPDVNKQPGAEEKFKEIARAYEVLSDPNLRARYDQFGEAGVRGGGVDMGDFGGDIGGLDDIFETFFGGGFGGGARRAAASRERGPVSGEDLRVDLEIDFKVAVFGGEETIRITHMETCAKCSGSGAKPGTRAKTCSTCGGQGQVARSTRTPFGSFSQVTTCPTCEGQGEVKEASCVACAGAGRVRANKKLSVGIPAGVDTGSRLRVRREGDAGPKGGAPGDLYVYIKVKSDPNFRREGVNIYSSVKVPYVDAILGTKVRVKTVEGEDELDVPSGTQPNTVLKLRGKGVPRLGNPSSKGDHFVTIVVEIPTRLSAKEKTLIEELRTAKSGSRGW
eukprot:CAMPEP_0184673750 /NCGR_PEP_ID=MMETSP0308-20130426/86852_1 /TAXON_ID=38269 /ORGANISM="Gloeochaete witrockiana, Strain SAG 46.84" /LENGTH=473 /DNA_ID=CAMNT_0027121269 /DNA_START=1 /DNA_END=1419 /DNA_ORIENTATION=+